MPPIAEKSKGQEVVADATKTTPAATTTPATPSPANENENVIIIDLTPAATKKKQPIADAMKTKQPTSMPQSENVVDLAQMTVKDLKSLCKELQIVQRGTKAEIVARIQETLGGVAGPDRGASVADLNKALAKEEVKMNDEMNDDHPEAICPDSESESESDD